MKISHKVPLIATSVILSAFAVFGSFQYKMIETNLYQSTQNNIKEVTRSLEEEISLWLNSRLRAVTVMAELIGNSTDEQKIAGISSINAFKDYADSYYAVLEQGDGHVISTQQFNLPSDWDGRQRPWYQLARRSRAAIFTTPYADSETNRLLVTASTRLGHNGVLAADIQLKAISDALNSVDFNQTGYAFLVNEAGTIITHPNADVRGNTLNLLYSDGVPKLDNTIQDNVIDKKTVLTSFYPLKNFKGSRQNWYIGVVVDKEKVLAPARRLIVNTAIAAIVTVIVSSVLFYLFMLSSLINPVNRLVECAEEISRGRFTSEIEGIHRKDEIGDLAQAVQRMQKALGMAMNRLRKQSR